MTALLAPASPPAATSPALTDADLAAAIDLAPSCRVHDTALLYAPCAAVPAPLWILPVADDGWLYDGILRPDGTLLTRICWRCLAAILACRGEVA